ncbi:TBC1 domain family member 22B [Calliphora vicina]|uniref:TBC1 domain family member 22B n=1 Tax=Calliphora vicina TaxID=7373 RepID=UPI00325C02E0
MDNNVDSVNNTSTTTTTSNLTTKTLSSSSSSSATTTAAAASAAQTKQQAQQPPILVTTTTNSFWKNSNRIVPGRPSPKRVNPLGDTVTGSGGVMMATFRDYQNSVSDAWDTGDDEFCIISSAAMQQQQQQHQQQNLHRSPDGTLSKTDPRISRQVSQTLAQNVIEIHKTSTAAGGVFVAANVGHMSNNNSNTDTSNQQQSHDVKCAAKQQQNDQSNKKECKVETQEQRPRIRHIQALPGRPQLQKFTTNSQDSEYETKIEKFELLLDSPLLDLVALKKLSWSGIPRKMRGISWRLLSKYLPPSGERRNAVLESKRQGYQDLRHNYFRVDSQDESQQDTYRQIHIDVPRMNPQISLFQQKLVQEMFERVLFIWSIRHPASGYVQGINDLVTPFFIVFLQEQLPPGTDIEKLDMNSLSVEIRDAIEADSFWCLSKFLDCIQDNYIFAQLGIQEKVNQLKDLIQRIDGTLHRHLQSHGVDYLQFSFRWMNNLLTRELPLHCTIRLWDTYLAESDGFALFHLYVCAAFLLHWKEELMQQNDFQGLLLLLQNLPTHNWSDRQINVLVAEAFRLKFTYADAPKHLEAKS